MTQDQILAALRHAATLAGGFAVGRGWITDNQLLAILGLLPGLIAAFYAFRSASPAAQIEKVASNPGVKEIVAKQTAAGAELVKAATSPKVVAQ
jgi:hypothetical protein